MKTKSVLAEAVLYAAVSSTLMPPLTLAAPAAVTSLGTSSRSTRTDSVLFAASCDGSDWTGGVTAQKIQAGTGTVESAGLWGDLPAVPATATKPAQPVRPKSTASIMDGKDGSWPASRLVVSARTAGPGAARAGIPWEWDELPGDQKTALRTVDGIVDASDTADATAQARMAFIRGDRTQEQSGAAAGPFRNRGSRHGDIVNSKLWYLDGKPSSGHAIEDYAAFRNALGATRASMLYVGANDGMLHGFDATTGEERIAYVPEGLHSKLALLTQPSYTHQHYVDGSPFTGDLYLGTPGSKDGTKWRTYLAGFLGAGGRGYFVLDVTNPAAFTAGNAANLVVMDKTGAASLDPDVGHIFGEPVMEGELPSVTRQIARMNDGRWALIMGNGYDSAQQRPVLLIQYLDGDKELIKIVAGSTSGDGNGLSPPRLVDFNGDNIPDVAYAGDLRGNLWKFDLSDRSPGKWHVAFDGVPLFAATDGATPASPQPITSAAVWAAHPDGGLMLAFGTGRNLTTADRADTSRQSIYGIYDNTQIARPPGSGSVSMTEKRPVSGRGELVEQTMIANPTQPVGTVSSRPVPYSGTGARRGWFVDLPVAGQRVLRNLNWFDGDLIDVDSTVPARGGDTEVESCDPPTASGKGYRTTIDIIQGGPPKSQIYAGLAPLASGQVATIEVGLNTPLSNGKQQIAVPPTGMPPPPTRDYLGRFVKRAAWRQMQ